MKVLINFADMAYMKQQKYNSKSGRKIGGFDKVIEYSPECIDISFRKRYSSTFAIERGCGLWLWKPYFILKTLNELQDNDYLFYCDSGAYFLQSIDKLIMVLERDQQDIMCFEIPLVECMWTSGSCIKRMKCEEKKYMYTPQRCASYILIKNTINSRRIILEYLDACEDIENLQGGELGEDCIAHREDQSIWSLVTKKNGIYAYRDPSQFGFFPSAYIQYAKQRRDCVLVGYTDQSKSTYPCVIYLYRKEACYRFIPRMKGKIGLYLKIFFKYKFAKVINSLL